jgi:predicted CoA-binding protein
MNHDTYDDAYLADVLRSVKTVAVVGASTNPARPSNYVARFLAEQGYRVHPVNPGHAGEAIDGREAFARLADVREPVDLVDIFRRQEDLAAVVEEALALDPLPKAIWMQMGLRDDAAAARAEAAGVRVVMDRCPKVEIPRLFPDGIR